MCSPTEDQILDDFAADRIDAEEMTRRLAALHPAPAREVVSAVPGVQARGRTAVRRILRGYR